MGDILIMYLEDDLDRAYRIDCKLRSKTDLAWLKREEFRKVYEEMLNAHLEGMPDMPLELAMQSVENILANEGIRFNKEELKEKANETKLT
jgi:hypothetical protein|tara:strand:- start:1232 stop:1504 length:273 start_codon:yes stop_codon:yes gene_type:complete